MRSGGVFICHPAYKGVGGVNVGKYIFLVAEKTDPRAKYWISEFVAFDTPVLFSD